MLKNRITYVMLLVVSGYLLILYESYATLLLFWTVLFFPLLSLLLFSIQCQKMQGKILTLEATHMIGETIKVDMELFNDSWFPVAKGAFVWKYQYCFDKKAKEQKVLFSMDSRERQKMQAAFLGKHAGTVTVSLEQLILYDMTGVFRRRKGIGTSRIFLVLPEYKAQSDLKVEEIADFTESEEEFSKVKPGDDSSEVFQIREYQPGDRIARIHWKLSSKRKQYMVKDFSLPIQSQERILFDCYLGAGDKMLKGLDQQISHLLSILYGILLENESIIVCWYDKKLKQLWEKEIKEELDIFVLLRNIFQTKWYEEESDFEEALVLFQEKEKQPVDKNDRIKVITMGEVL